ncbi:agamous-like MADS-box protein MADS9 isoform X2 [Syzygium oleosum]|uniref:agamous-like MADS-box protein MADS9 isoform X2 n=1 Tax=Syzygium oleosum TaxID=219896 RepID=UPI0024B983C1|nr:agamous-like MADS-box protein MADS9 isoform X2 [Syzygium oleosum]
MGRGKIEIKRIENTNNRQVTYSKRRSGIIKKAKEISVLCDAHVAVIIFGCSGKMHEYCSPKASLVDILDQYHTQCGTRLWDAKHENLSNEIDRIKKANDNLQMQLRHLKGEDITSLNYKDLMVLEDVLENGLGCVRDQKDEVVVKHRRNKEEVIKELYLFGQHTEMMMAENGRGGDDAYHQRLNSHTPFAIRGRPVQPKSRERI